MSQDLVLGAADTAFPYCGQLHGAKQTIIEVASRRPARPTRLPASLRALATLLSLFASAGLLASAGGWSRKRS